MLKVVRLVLTYYLEQSVGKERGFLNIKPTKERTDIFIVFLISRIHDFHDVLLLHGGPLQEEVEDP